MFDGLPGDDHHQHHEFHHFIASSRTPLPIHHLHGNPAPFSAPPAIDDPYQELIPKTTGIEGDHSGKHVGTNHLFSTMEEEMRPPMVPWSSDEVSALLKLKSAMELSFSSDFTWEHISRKLGEMGFKRNPEDCKRKYAEEGKHLHFTSPSTFSKTYKIFSELDELYPNTQNQAQQLHKNDNVQEKPGNINGNEDDSKPKTRQKRKKREEEDEEEDDDDDEEEEEDEDEEEEEEEDEEEEERFEMLKGFVEGIVGKMMAQQEEMHNKLIEDMVRRDEEKVAQELAWKRQEMERIQTEIEMRAKQTASAGARQVTMIEFLKAINNSTTSLSDQNPNPNPNSPIKSPPSPSSAVMKNTETPSSPSGKRWPRDEILALINLRCKINSSNEEGSGHGGVNSNKGPLWERISAGMVELGYKRSAKRCKEKWENINKYFRKTRDSNKKRSVDSRTCPYFHQLTCLYTQGTLLPPNSTE